MKKSPLANQNIMKQYLSELLTVEYYEKKNTVKTHTDVITTQPTKITNQRLDKLFGGVEQKRIKDREKVLNVKESQPCCTSKKFEKNMVSEEKFKQKHDIATNISEVDVRHESILDKVNDIKGEGEVKQYRQGNFQTLFFDVAGLLIAVPLIELGGIHKAKDIKRLMGTPPWYKGVMNHRKEKVNVVDTALWIMPERCDDELLESINYQNIIMLGNSMWGLLAEKLVDTVTLEQDDVKWLDKPSKRPWLAGIVKQKMCVLLNVDTLIKLLNEGESILLK
jgi:purine-binding chemotaxis protein CheW